MADPRPLKPCSAGVNLQNFFVWRIGGRRGRGGCCRALAPGPAACGVCRVACACARRDACVLVRVRGCVS